MSDKARGNETAKPQPSGDDDLEDLDDSADELSIDRDTGERLDQSDRWWDDSPSEEKAAKQNRRLTEEERAELIAKKAKKVGAKADDSAEGSTEVSRQEEDEKAVEDEGEDDELELKLMVDPEDQEEDDEGGADEDEEEAFTKKGLDLSKEDSKGEPPSDSDDELDDFDLFFSDPADDEKSKGEEDSADVEKREIEDKEEGLPPAVAVPNSLAAELKEQPLPKPVLPDVDESEESEGDEERSEKGNETIDQAEDEEADEDEEVDEEVEDEQDSEDSESEVDEAEVEEKAGAKEKEEKSETEPQKEKAENLEDKDADDDLSFIIDDPEPVENDEKPGLGEMIQSSTAVPAEEKPKRGCWATFATFFFIVTMLLVVAVAVAGFLAWKRFGDLEAQITATAQTALEKQGIYAGYDGWEYRFPRGLILKDVTLFETEQRQVPVLNASDIGVNVDLIGLIKDRSSVTGGEVSFDQSSLTFFHEGEERARFEAIDAEILVNTERIQVERFSGMVGGLVVTASGRLAVESFSGPEVGSATGVEPEQAEAGGASQGGLPFDFSVLEQIQPWLEIQANGASPRLDVTFGDFAGAASSMQINATLTGRDFVWRNLLVTSVSGACQFIPESKILDVTAFQLGYGGGFIGGVGTYHLETKLLELTKAQSSIDLVAFLTAYDAAWGEKLKSIRLVDAPVIQASGTIPVGEMDKTQLAVSYDHRLGLIYLSEGRELPIRSLQGRFDLSGGSLESNDFSAQILGGMVGVNGTARLNTDPKPFSGLIEVSEMSMAEIAEYFELGDIGMTGNLFITFRGTGYTDIPRIRGGGNLRIDDAALTGFPVIGQVQNLLGKVIPVFGVEGKGAVTGAYLMESGVLFTNDLTVSQSGAKLVVKGSLNLESKNTDFTATASLEPSLATATGLGGKSITIVGEGPLTSPNLSLKDFPLDFASDALSDVLGTTPESLGQLQGLLGGGTGGAAQMIEEQLEAETGVELPAAVGDLFRGMLDAVKDSNEAADSEVELEVPETAESEAPPEAQPVRPAPAIPFRAQPVTE
ncbi:MAG: hypothetical protein AAGA96_11270 [Verrucomicrobiota bacterium]